MKKILFIGVMVFAVLSVGGICMASMSINHSNDKVFVKTKNRCTKCSCTGYWGYKHLNGTYEGSCSNTDGHGHTCGHGPEKHGLRKW